MVKLKCNGVKIVRVNKSENINVAGFPDLLPGLKVGENGTFEAWTYKTGLTEHFQIKRGLSSVHVFLKEQF